MNVSSPLEFSINNILSEQRITPNILSLIMDDIKGADSQNKTDTIQSLHFGPSNPDLDIIAWTDSSTSNRKSPLGILERNEAHKLSFLFANLVVHCSKPFNTPFRLHCHVNASIDT